VIEITFSVRLVQKTVEITKVVARLGEELWGPTCSLDRSFVELETISSLRGELMMLGNQVTDPKFVAGCPIEAAARFVRGARPAQGCLDRR
jgi:hypothetical protein